MSDNPETNDPFTIDVPPAAEPAGEQPASAAPTVEPRPISESDERTLAVVSHLSIFLNLVTGFLGSCRPHHYYLIKTARAMLPPKLQALIFPVGFLGSRRTHRGPFLGNYRHHFNRARRFVLHSARHPDLAHPLWRLCLCHCVRP